MKKVIKVNWNWRPAPDGYAICDSAHLHKRASIGALLCTDIILEKERIVTVKYENGDCITIFNPNEIHYKEIANE